jgi:hypothetical protein
VTHEKVHASARRIRRLADPMSAPGNHQELEIFAGRDEGIDDLQRGGWVNI